MATKKQEKEQRRLARIEAEKREAREQRRRLILGYAVAGVLGAIVLGAAGYVLISGGDDAQKGANNEDIPAAAHVDQQSGTPPEGVAFDDREGTAPPAIELGDLEEAAKAADCELDLGLEDEGNTHLKPDEDPPNYKTNPPTSGNHIVPPLQAADGAYLDPVDPVNFVHSLEHGRVEILYNPDLGEDDQLALKGLFDEDPNGMLLFPYPDMPYDVAVTAWTNMATCDKYSEGVLDVIRDFRDTYRGQGPEQVPL